MHSTAPLCVAIQRGLFRTGFGQVPEGSFCISSLFLTRTRKKDITSSGYADGSDDKILRLWNLETGACTRELEGHTSAVTDVAWSSDGRRALSGSSDNTVRLWDVE